MAIRFPIEPTEPRRPARARARWDGLDWVVVVAIGWLFLMFVLAALFREDPVRSSAPVRQTSRPLRSATDRASLPSPALAKGELLPPLDLRAAEALPHPLDGQSIRLANGLELILVEDHTTPTIAAQVVFRVGAAHEPSEHAGSVHLLEHLMFHGTSRLGTRSWRKEAPHYALLRELTEMLAEETDPGERKAIEAEMALVHAEADQHGIPGELRRLLDELGATQVNAKTTLDATAYTATLPSEKLLPWAVTLAEQLSDPVLRAFVNEREIVHEELGLRDSPCISSWEDLRTTLFEGHPYGNALGGTPESLAATSIASLEALFETTYGPGNAAVVLVGDLDPREARQIVQDTFGQWPQRPTVGVPEVGEPPRLVGVQHIASAPKDHLRMGWALGPLGPGEAQALRVFSSALQEAIAARGGALRPSVVHSPFRQGTMLVVEVQCLDSVLCERSILEGIRAVRDGAVTERQIERVRVRAWVEYLRTLEDPATQAEEIAKGWARGTSSRDLWLQLVGIRAVTREQVRALAAKVDLGRYVVQEPGYAKHRPSRSRSHAVTSEVDGEVSQFYLDVLALPVPDRPPRWRTSEDFTVADEGRIIAVPNPANTLFQATLAWPIGWGDDRALCLALDSWMYSRRVTPRKALAPFGTRVSGIGCRYDQVDLRLDGPGETATSSLRTILAQVAAGVPAGVGLEPNARRTAPQNSLQRLLYGPKEPQISKAAERTLSELAQTLSKLGSVEPTLEYSGPGAASELASVVSGGPRRLRPAEPITRVPRSFVALGPPLERSTVTAVRVGEPYDPEREALYEVYDRWLGGPAGLMADRLRRESGRTYVINAEYRRGRAVGEPNSTVVYATSLQPDLVLRVVDTLTSLSTDDERFIRALASTEVHAWSEYVPFREAPAEIASWLLHELPADRQEIIWEGLPRVNRATFDAFLAEENARPLRVSARGQALDRARLSALGVEVVDDVLSGR